MKMLSITLLGLVLTVNSALACEFTSIAAKVKVQYRSLDYRSHKEKIKNVGHVGVDFVKNTSGSYKVFSMNKDQFPIDVLDITEKYDYYSTTVRLNTKLPGNVLIAVLTEAIGERKLAKDQKLKELVGQLTENHSVTLSSSYYAFHGNYYGETEDGTEDYFVIKDPTNPENKMIITFDFKRKTKCN